LTPIGDCSLMLAAAMCRMQHASGLAHYPLGPAGDLTGISRRIGPPPRHRGLMAAGAHTKRRRMRRRGMCNLPHAE
jgi:hypothetical protein